MRPDRNPTQPARPGQERFMPSAAFRRDAEGGDDEAALDTADNGYFGEMAQRHEPELVVKALGRGVMVEVHAQQRRDPEPRAVFDHPPLEELADPLAVVRS